VYYIAFGTLLRAHHIWFRQLYCIPWGNQPVTYCVRKHLKGISPRVVSALLHSLRRWMCIILHSEPSREHISVGCVSFTAILEAINVYCIAFGNPLREHHRGLCQLNCIPWGNQRLLFWVRNPIKGTSPWVCVSFAAFLEAIIVYYIAFWTLSRAYHRWLCQLYSIPWRKNVHIEMKPAVISSLNSVKLTEQWYAFWGVLYAI
jgi:hypothetical protein